MKLFLLFLSLPAILVSQDTITTSRYDEYRWMLNSSINLPAAKFHVSKSNSISRTSDDPKGYLELFSAFGVGLSFNFGKASFKKDIYTNNILEEETIFSNLIGFQIGVLYSSKVNEETQSNLNDFSIYGGLNLLDIQLGLGYEFGSNHFQSTRWFVSIAYGIPLYKLTGKGSYLFKKRKVGQRQSKDVIDSAKNSFEYKL